MDTVLAAATLYPPPIIKKSLAERADFRRMVFDACVMREGKEQVERKYNGDRLPPPSPFMLRLLVYVLIDSPLVVMCDTQHISL